MYSMKGTIHQSNCLNTTNLPTILPFIKKMIEKMLWACQIWGVQDYGGYSNPQITVDTVKSMVYLHEFGFSPLPWTLWEQTNE